MINVFRVGNQNAIKVSNTVNEYINTAKLSLPKGVTITSWNDESKILRGRIDLLMRNAKLGLVLVLLMLAVFLKPKLAFWVSLGIPISFMGALIMLPYLDVSINLLSLFTFILVLGIVVDDAIIVGENIYRHIENGEDSKIGRKILRKQYPKNSPPKNEKNTEKIFNKIFFQKTKLNKIIIIYAEPRAYFFKIKTWIPRAPQYNATLRDYR